MRGKKLPTRVKELQGTLEKSRVLPNEVEFKPVDSIPVPPDYFGEIARAEWFRLIPELKDKGLLNEPDLPQLRLYCWNIQVAEECAGKLKEGYTQTITNKGGHSYDVPSPFVKMHNDATAIINRIASKFGFDPLSRSKVAAPEKKDKEDPMSGLMGKAG